MGTLYQSVNENSLLSFFSPYNQLQKPYFGWVGLTLLQTNANKLLGLLFEKNFKFMIIFYIRYNRNICIKIASRI